MCKIVQYQINGEAEAARLKVSAGLTPQERIEWEYKTKVGVAQALSGIKYPQILIVGGEKGGSGNAMDAINIKFLMDINDRLAAGK